MTEMPQKTKKQNATTQMYATAAANGVTGAFEELVSLWSGYLYQKVKPKVEKVGGTHEDAEELVNTILFKTHNALCAWDRKSPFAAIIHKITQNAVADYYRALSDAPYIKTSDGDILYRYVSLDNPDEYLIDRLADERGEELFREADIRDLREAIKLVIDSTFGKTQAEVMKRCMNDEEPDQIAAEMKLTPSTVYYHIREATRKLLANQSIHSMLSAFVFFGGDKGMEDIAVPAGLTAKIMENIVAQNAAGAATTAATATATTTATAATVSHTGIGAAIMGLGAGAKAGIAIAAAVVITGGVAVPVYIHNENQKAVQAAAIIEQQEQERAASEAAETARIAAEEQAQREREAEAAQIAAEKAAAEKAEQERKAAEEKAEAERLAAEQVEQERIAAEEKARLEAEAEAAQPAPSQPAQPAPQQQTPPPASSTPTPPPASSTPSTPPPSSGGGNSGGGFGSGMPGMPTPSGPGAAGNSGGNGWSDGSGGDRWRG